MGFLDSIFGGGGSKTKVKFEQSPQQERLGGAITPFLTQLFKENAWQNLLPTAEIMRSLDPSIRESLWQPVEYGADRLAEQLEARGQTGGSFQTAMGEYYGQAAPGISAQMANLVTPALSAPYNLAAGLYPQTLAYPVVQQGSPSFMQSFMGNVMPPLAAGLGFAAGGPIGGMIGGGIGGMFGGGNWGTPNDPYPY